jgi:uncharacterized protein YqjF (DUF2071 family)
MIAAHRPWEVPQRPWVMSMQWHQLLFAHWAVRPAQLEPLIPQGLQLETFDGFAWLGVVPFQMRRTIPRNLFSLYSADTKGRVYRGEIHHEPWNLQPAEAEFTVNTVAEGIGVRLEGTPQTLHFSSRIDVQAWLLERIK